jgi:transcriptional regulator with XRE-family HTH domain
MDDAAFIQDFAYRVRRRRQACGLSQRQVADAIGMSGPQYSRLEAGSFQLVHIAQLARLADALHTSVDYLFLRSEDAGEVPPHLCPAEELTLDGSTPLPATTVPQGDNDCGEYTAFPYGQPR